MLPVPPGCRTGLMARRWPGRRRNLHRRRAVVGAGKAHRRRFLRASFCKTGMSSSAGPMWIAVYLGIWSGLQAVSRGLGVIVSWMERHALALVVVLAAAVLAGIRWFAPSDCGRRRLLPSPPMPVAAGFGLRRGRGCIDSSRLSPTRNGSALRPLMILAGTAAVAGLIVADPWLRLGLLELGALLTVALVWQSARTQAAKLTYLAVVLISAVSLVSSDLLMERGQADWARALLLTSVCVKLAAVPLFFWLLSAGRRIPCPGSRPDYCGCRYGRLRRTVRCRSGFSGLAYSAGIPAGRSRRHVVPCRSSDAHAAQPQAPAGSLHGRGYRLSVPGSASP